MSKGSALEVHRILELGYLDGVRALCNIPRHRASSIDPNPSRFKKHMDTSWSLGGVMCVRLRICGPSHAIL